LTRILYLEKKGGIRWEGGGGYTTNRSSRGERVTMGGSEGEICRKNLGLPTKGRALKEFGCGENQN